MLYFVNNLKAAKYVSLFPLFTNEYTRDD